MKTSLITVIACSLAAIPGVGFAGSTETQQDAVQVAFNEPEKFTDFKTSEHFRASDAQALQDEITRAIERSAHHALPPGYTLSIRFSDIDLAGDVNPYQRINMRDVREYRSVYPPRLTFDYSVTDAQGNVVLSGSERLVDLAYDMQVRIPDHDYTRVESDMLRDFVRGLGRKIAKGQPS